MDGRRNSKDRQVRFCVRRFLSGFWMVLRCFRYDCRGALSDLRTCEASREGYDAMRWLGLSESERRLEQLCDEERYYFLHKNEEEEELYKGSEEGLVYFLRM